MQMHSDTLACPFCGTQMSEFNSTQMSMLRAISLSDMVAASLHDLSHAVDFLQATHEDVQSVASLGKPYEEAVGRHAQAVGHVDGLVKRLRHLPSRRGDDRILPLRRLPEHLDPIWRTSRLLEPPDLGVFDTSGQRIRLSPYLDTLNFAIQVASMAVRRDRAPSADIAFALTGSHLVTSIGLRHHDTIYIASTAWTCFLSAVRYADGTHLSSVGQNRTTLEWRVPLA